jgi:Cu-Zn family superoxide dismutase
MACAVNAQNTRTASCTVVRGFSTVEGNIALSQPESGGNVTLTINLSGFNGIGKHGFHVHAVNSLADNCTAAGSHLNLDSTNHGGPTDPKNMRHTGDLGNIQADASGSIKDLRISDWVISLTGATNVVGKPIVIHAGEDDLGKGSEPDSNTTGHAGARLGCCLITLDSAANHITIPVSSGIIGIALVIFSLYSAC